MFRVLLALCAVVWAVGCVPQKPEKKAEKAPMEKQMGDRPANPHATSGPGLDINHLLAELPEGWSKVTPASSMRLGQVSLARAAGDNADGELAIFHFPGTGGSSMANLERWESQMAGPNGAPAVAKTDSMKLDNGILVITVDISGTLLASTMGTGPSTDQPGYRMLASVLETPAGNYFTKLTGPEKTIAAHAEKYRTFLKRAKLGGNA